MHSSTQMPSNNRYGSSIDYPRNILNLPVPHILTYSADMSMFEMGAEFISMEHVQDVKLHERVERFGYEATYFVDQLANMVCKFARCHFFQIGSLYHKEDVSPELQQRPLYAEGTEGAKWSTNVDCSINIGLCTSH